MDYTEKPPGDKPPFTCMHSPTWENRSRWIAHDWNGHCAGEFDGEDEARAAVKRWTENSGERVTVDWEEPPGDDDGWHRGTYVIRITGTKYENRDCSGSHSGSASTKAVQELRDLISAHGIDAVLNSPARREANHPWAQGRRAEALYWQNRELLRQNRELREALERITAAWSDMERDMGESTFDNYPVRQSCYVSREVCHIDHWRETIAAGEQARETLKRNPEDNA